MKSTDRLLSAQRYAFLLLKFRPRSEKEMRDRLGRKDFSKGIIEKTVQALISKKFIDDRLFAEAWIDYRINKSFGFRKVRRELRGKGIPGRIIEECLARIQKDYSEETVVERSAREKIGKLKGIDGIKAKNRVYAYLLRRGFTPSVVIEVMNRLMGETGRGE
ncbi:MAG: regulatory protein RecX [Candidatus Omnitrophota bacterium]